MTTVAPGQANLAPSPNRYARWRVVSLVAVHLAIAAHIVHWRLNGTTLAPLELNEVVYTLELGIVTAGFLLMALATLAAAIFGRFFCAWACHLLALQDLCAWLLGRMGIHPKPIRSRALRVAPFVVMFYMFVWPQLERLWRGQPLPSLHVRDQQQLWASFQTDDFWRNLPGPWIAGLTFLVCGFLIVWQLGSRAFCSTGCPYGAVFALADRLAPVRIALRGTCTDCGRCTAVCQSGVVVHQEVQRLGRIVDPACLKDLDCVAVCPEQALRVGLARPAGLTSLASTGQRRGFAWRLGEDLLAGVAMLATILATRGLYDAVPFLMAVGLGAIAAGFSVTTLRILRANDATFRQLRLRRDGRYTGAGRLWLAATAVAVSAWLHAAFLRWHEFTGIAAFERVRVARAADDRQQGAVAVQEALAHLEACEQYGWFNSLDHERRLAALYGLVGRFSDVVRHLQRVVHAHPNDHEARLRLASAFLGSQRLDAAAAELRQLDAIPDLPAGIRQSRDAIAQRLAAASAR